MSFLMHFYSSPKENYLINKKLVFSDLASDLLLLSSNLGNNQIILFLAAVKMHKNNTFKSLHVLQKNVNFDNRLLCFQMRLQIWRELVANC
jgi:hypothetical protein